MRKGDSRGFGFVCKRRRRERRKTRGLVDLDLCASRLCNLGGKKDTLIFLYSSPLCLRAWLPTHTHTHAGQNAGPNMCVKEKIYISSRTLFFQGFRTSWQSLYAYVITHHLVLPKSHVSIWANPPVSAMVRGRTVELLNYTELVWPWTPLPPPLPPPSPYLLPSPLSPSPLPLPLILSPYPLPSPNLEHRH